MKPSVVEMERVLRHHYPDVSSFPLVRTLAAVAWELGISQHDLLRTLPDRRILWRRKGKIYVPPDVYERWRTRFTRS